MHYAERGVVFACVQTCITSGEIDQKVHKIAQKCSEWR